MCKSGTAVVRSRRRCEIRAHGVSGVCGCVCGAWVPRTLSKAYTFIYKPRSCLLLLLQYWVLLHYLGSQAFPAYLQTKALNVLSSNAWCFPPLIDQSAIFWISSFLTSTVLRGMRQIKLRRWEKGRKKSAEWERKNIFVVFCLCFCSLTFILGR